MNRNKNTFMKRHLYLNNYENKYKHKEIKKLLKKYNEEKDEKIKNIVKQQIIKNSLVIVFGFLKKFSKKINTSSAYFDNEDLFNECIIVLSKCIDGFDINNKEAKFMTYVYTALDRNSVRFLHKNYLKHKQNNIPLSQHLNEDSNLDDEDIIESKKEYATKDNFHSEEQYIKDVRSLLSGAELEVFDMKRNGVDINLICNNMGISQIKYYKILENIKIKIKDELYD